MKHRLKKHDKIDVIKMMMKEDVIKSLKKYKVLNYPELFYMVDTLFSEKYLKQINADMFKEKNKLIIELIDLLFQVDDDKNDNLSDAERWKYCRLQQKLKKLCE